MIAEEAPIPRIDNLSASDYMGDKDARGCHPSLTVLGGVDLEQRTFGAALPM
jgi:hypothetical protein